MTHDVFVSYSSKDKAVADTIVAAMEKNGIRCWYAPRDIKPGDDWAGAITEAIESCRIFLMIFSQNANQSQRVLDELNYAVSQELVILPFRIENLAPKGAMMLHLSSRHWLDAYDPSWESHIRKLIQTVSSNLDKGLVDGEIEVPTHVLKQESRLQKKRIRQIVIWVIVGAMGIAGAWFGLSNLLGGEKVAEETEEIQTVQTTEAVVTPEITTTEEVEITQEVVITETDESSLCKIIFYSERDGQKDVYMMDPDGSHQTQMTFNQELDLRMEYSPDGTQFVFQSMRDGDNELYLMNGDGSNIRKLTDNETDDINPKWSPDGKQIGFFSNRGGGYDLYIMNADGSEQTRITNHNFLNSTVFGSKLSWSSDGSMILFTSDVDGDYELYLMDVDGINVTQLTDNEYYEGNPNISPDMSQILFDSDRYGDYEIFIMNIDGTNIRQLTSNNGISSNPRFSPLGSKIIFASNRTFTDSENMGESLEIYMMDLDGSNVVRLTENNYLDADGKFSPLCEF